MIPARSPSLGWATVEIGPSVRLEQGAMLGAPLGSTVYEVPTSSAPKRDLVIIGSVGQMDGVVTTGTAVNGNGAATDAGGHPYTAIANKMPTGWYANGSGANEITKLDQPCYAYNGVTLYATDLNGTLPFAGFCDGLNQGRVRVRFVADLVRITAGTDTPAGGTVRCVITSLAVHSGSTTGTLTADANGAIGAQDGVTLAVGDEVLVPEGTTNLEAASDAGPYTVAAVGDGSHAFVLKRPPWYVTGGAMPLGLRVSVAEGTVYGGTTWRSYAAKGGVVDTTAPVLFPERVTVGLTLASGTATTTALPVRSATKSAVVIASTPTAGPHADTVRWRVSALTTGALGISSATVVAEEIDGTTNTSDTSTVTVSVFN